MPTRALYTTCRHFFALFLLPPAKSHLSSHATHTAFAAFFLSATGGSLPPSAFCPAGNTPLPPLRALNRRARNAPGSASPYSKYSNSSIKLQGYRIDFFS